MATNDGKEAAMRSTANTVPKQGEQAAASPEDKKPICHTICDDSAEVLTTWAVPVKVEELGAHLEAYFDGFTARIAFKVCIDKSQGSMTALSTNLVDEIFDYVVHGEREVNRVVWSARYSISTGSNGIEALDHTRDMIMIDQPESETALRRLLRTFEHHCPDCLDNKYDITSATEEGSSGDENSDGILAPKMGDPDATLPGSNASFSCRGCHDFDGSVWELHSASDELAIHLGDSELWNGQQNKLARDWSWEVTHETLLRPEWVDLLRKDFDLDVWVGIREMRRHPPAFSTTAFLIPVQAKTYSAGLVTIGTAGYKVMDVAEGPRLRSAQRAAFKRALRILQLSALPHLERESSPAIGTKKRYQKPMLVSLAKPGSDPRTIQAQ